MPLIETAVMNAAKSIRDKDPETASEIIPFISSLDNFNPFIFFCINLNESGGSAGFTDTTVSFLRSFFSRKRLRNTPISPGSTIVPK